MFVKENDTVVFRFASGRDIHSFQVAHMDVSENSGTPKSSILIGFSIINHFWKHPYIYIFYVHMISL